MNISIPKEIIPVIEAVCRKNFIMPHDLFRLWAGEVIRQPFLIVEAEITGRDQKSRYLKILYFLWKADTSKFESVVSSYRGNKRRLFARVRDEVETTGSSNTAEKLYDSGWFVSVGMSGNLKQSRISHVMLGMGFTWDYASAVGWYPYDGSLRLQI
jgi:negative regulator of replication initiation